MPTNEHYDVVIIGSGAGGGTLASKLAPSGKRILLLERGGYLPRERDNWDTTAVFLQGKYSTDEEWRDRKGNEFTPEQNYYVGGNTKFYGAALLRLRPEDFGEIKHHGGVSPAWPLSYTSAARSLCATRVATRRWGATPPRGGWGSCSTRTCPETPSTPAPASGATGSTASRAW